MATFSHYVDVMLRTPEIAHDLYSRLVMAAHYRIKAGHALAIAWPDWKTERGDFGFLFRVFGSEQSLGAYLDSVRPLQEAELIRSFPVALVPERVKRVTFCRDRSVDHYSPCAARRLTSRANKRGETFIPKSAPVKQYHFLAIESASSKTQFNLFVRRSLADQDQAGGHQYGLGYAVPDF